MTQKKHSGSVESICHYDILCKVIATCCAESCAQLSKKPLV